jgi:DNA primase
MALGIGWSSKLHRIVLPVYSDSGDLLYYQCRAVDKGQVPKYINPRADKSTLLYTRFPPGSNRHRVIVTEDILSCIKVGRHIRCVSILGTATSTGQATRLARYNRVTYWLDPDKAGLRGSAKGVKTLKLLTSADAIYSNKDPKNLSDRVIREHLCLPYKERYTYIGPLDLKTIETQAPLPRVSTRTTS